jgi:hypothetical protein
MQSLVNLYRKAGGRLLPLEQVKERYEICKVCEHFNGRGCDLCGCCTGKRKSLFNKLAYPMQSCPDKPPRWNAVE